MEKGEKRMHDRPEAHRLRQARYRERQRTESPERDVWYCRENLVGSGPTCTCGRILPLARKGRAQQKTWTLNGSPVCRTCYRRAHPDRWPDLRPPLKQRFRTCQVCSRKLHVDRFWKRNPWYGNKDRRTWGRFKFVRGRVCDACRRRVTRQRLATPAERCQDVGKEAP